ncbi:ferric iron uptake transcriptional regulator [Magnetovirga frankeli]|uniref:ferric iron uptake transcriptional regulator n=1 Tax=Magnetovirga frankeli TaxID=947516 RepID=UPI0012933D38|nr:ferric iron uptake transcriptional regulator [gamma proteobacterium SS-5]
MRKDQIKKAGLKVTQPRMKILNLLENHADEHYSAEDVYRKLLDTGDDLGLATIYRVLTQFEEAGLVVRHHFEGQQSIFELNRGDHHDHILCIDCGQVEEFEDEVIERRQHDIAEGMGFGLKRHALTLYGHCQRKDCPNRPD